MAPKAVDAVQTLQAERIAFAGMARSYKSLAHVHGSRCIHGSL
jgi:hypothetical protein